MEDEPESEEQFEAELARLRQRVAELEAVQAEQQQTEDGLHAALDNAAVGITQIDTSGRFVDFNDTWCHMLGYTREELLNLTVRDVTATGEPVLLPADIEGEESHSRIQKRYVRKDGTTFWGDLCTTVVRDQSGEVKGMLGIVAEGSEYKKAEEALRESEEKYRTLVERANDGIAIVQDMVVQYANRSLAEMRGQRVEEIIGTRFVDYFQPDELPGVIDRYTQRMAGQEVTPTYEMTFFDKDGRKVYVEVNAGIITYQGRPADLVIVRDVTERKLLEQQIEERRLYLESVLACAPDAIVALDATHNILEWNPGAERLFGYGREEALGRNIDHMITHSDTQVYQEAVDYTRQVLAGGTIPPSEAVRYRKDGTPVDVIVAGAPILVRGELVGVAAVYTDISERKRAEEAVRRRAEELAALQATVLAITTADDLPTLLHTIVERAAGLLNAPAGGLYLCDPDRKEVRCVISDNTPRDYSGTTLAYGEGVAGTVAKTGRPLIIDDYRVWPGRADVFEEEQPFTAVIGVPMIWQDQVIGVIDVLHDQEGHRFVPADLELLTLFANHAAIAVENTRLYEQAQIELAERRRVEEVLRRYARRLEVLHETDQAILAAQSPEAIARAVMVRIQQLVPCDRASVVAFDLPAREARVLAIHVDGETREGADEQASMEPFEGLKELEQGRVRAVADVLDLSAPTPRDGALQAEGVRSYIDVPLVAQGQLIGVLNVGASRPGAFAAEHLDIVGELATELAVAVQNAHLHAQVRRHAEELTDAVARLQELDRLKSEFIQNVSHELRSPLALVRGYAELLLAGEFGMLDPPQRNAGEIIARRAQMVGDLVEDITLILSAEARPPVREPVALDELVRVALRDFQVVIAQAELTLEAEIAPDLPPVWGEVGYLRRVLDNLVGNAVKFTPTGGTITVRLWRAEKNVVMQVADTGIGISSDEQQRVFERFYQVDGSARRRYSGVGLGLALVKEIVEAFDGTVSVHSLQGGGSTFTVTLPILGT
jgi:PAS domain S-box-containing protein